MPTWRTGHRSRRNGVRWPPRDAISSRSRAWSGRNGDGFSTSDAGQVLACCDVLEHLVDPAAAVRRIVELLEPGGYLFATVPDSGSLVARALGARWWSVLPMHVQYFTPGSLARLLRDGGLSIRSTRTHPKIFSRRYYGDRLGEFVPVIGPTVARLVSRSRGADRPFGPDFRDRAAVIAQRRAARTGATP